MGDYPGTKRANEDIWDVNYREGILVGYRWFDTKKIKPLYAFGHGLSYTTFDLGKATADRSAVNAGESLTVSVPVTNTGKVAGAEVVQLYITDPKCTVMRPAKELKGFSKVFLQPGETKTVTFTVSPEDLSYFDAEKHQWVAEPGEFVAQVGTASDRILSTAKFRLN